MTKASNKFNGRKVLIIDYLEGGLEMIDIASFNRSLIDMRIKRYLIRKTVQVGKVIFDSELEKYGGEVTPTGYNIKDSRKVSDPFFQ